MPDYIKLAYLMFLKYGGFVAEAKQLYDPNEPILKTEYKIVSVCNGAKYHLTLTLDRITGTLDAEHGAESIRKNMNGIDGTIYYGDYV